MSIYRLPPLCPAGPSWAEEKHEREIGTCRGCTDGALASWSSLCMSTRKGWLVAGWIYFCCGGGAGWFQGPGVRESLKKEDNKSAITRFFLLKLPSAFHFFDWKMLSVDGHTGDGQPHEEMDPPLFGQSCKRVMRGYGTTGASWTARGPAYCPDDDSAILRAHKYMMYLSYRGYPKLARLPAQGRRTNNGKRNDSDTLPCYTTGSSRLVY